MVDNDKETWWPNLNGINKNQRKFRGIVIKDYAPSSILLETGDYILLENNNTIEV